MSFPLQERVWSPFVSSLFHHSPAASSKRHSGQVGDGQFEGKVGLWLNWELVPLCDPGKLPSIVLGCHTQPVFACSCALPLAQSELDYRAISRNPDVVFILVQSACAWTDGRANACV